MRMFIIGLMLLCINVAVAGPAFKTGQEWKYQTRAGEPDSTLVIGPIEHHRKYGKVIHIKIQNVNIGNANSKLGISNVIHHAPMLERALSESVIRVIKTGVRTEGIEKGIEQWRQKNSSVFRVPVSEVVQVIDDSINK